MNKAPYLGSLLVTAFSSAASWAQSSSLPPAPTIPLAPMAVSGTRIAQDPQQLPMAIDVIDSEQIREQNLQVNLSESLQRVPGINVQNRGNYAQDLQISSRGFGGRASFGVRGIRLFTDGIPASQPDGQGQVSHFALASADRIEVLRGPFSALYGNASGGVMQIFTEDAGRVASGNLSLAIGPNTTSRAGFRASTLVGTVGIVGEASEFQTHGIRPQSAASKTLGQLKLTGNMFDTGITFLGNSVKINADDALGLTRAEFDTNPDQTTAAALQFKTRKTTRQEQAGIKLVHALGAGLRADAVIYTGTRDVTQWQAIPVATQTPATQPGGVIAFARAYTGTDVKLAHESAWGNVVAGVAFDTLDEERKGFENFIGSELGVTGKLRRDETNNVQNRDVYLQSQLKLSPSFTLTAGARRSEVRFTSLDHYIIAGRNPDDSGRATYSKLTPALGASVGISKDFNVYASIGRGFETPTFNELSYRADGQTGLNFDLKPAVSDSAELGMKLRGNGWRSNVALFETRTRDEIVTLTNSGGRATFQNAGKTLRRGAELRVGASVRDQLELSLSLTALDAKYDQAFKTCTVAPCTAPTTVVNSGNKLPGVPSASAFVEAKWTTANGVMTAIEIKQQSKIYVNDLNSDAASAYTVANLRVGYGLSIGAARISLGARLDNLADKRYAGTVIVNEANGRFFEPAQGRNWLVSVGGKLPF